MAYWQNMSPEFRVRLIEISDLFLKCREAFHATTDRYHWIPEPRSAAAEDAAALPSPDPEITAPHGETGHRMIAEVVQTFLLTASGHLGALASLYKDSEVLFSPPLLVRAVVENCAHALWVLGDDPDEAPENRLARAYLEELLSAEEARKNAGRMRTKAHPSYEHADIAYTALKQQILARFPSASRQDLGNRTLNGQKLPNLEATVTWMYALTERHGGTIKGDTASGIYGFLSNMTHPTLYPARQRQIRGDNPAHDHPVTHLHIELGSIEDEARAALASFYNALTYTTSYFGWPPSAIGDLEKKIEETMPTFFR